MTGDLIACARYRIYDLKAKAAKNLTTHVLFVIHLPRSYNNSSFVGFQGDPWVSFHIDDLRSTNDVSVSVKEAMSMTISAVFIGAKPSSWHNDLGNSSEDELDTRGSSGDVSSEEPSENHRISSQECETASYGRLHGCIQAAASKLKDTSKRCTERLSLLVHLVPKMSSGKKGECKFCHLA